MALAQPVERVPPITGEWPDLGSPTPRFDSLRPFAAHQHLRIVDLVDGAIARPVVRDALFLAADADREGLSLKARDGMDARDLQEVRHVLGVVDLVEERIFVRIDIHAGDEHIP